MLILGGTGRLYGAIIGAIIFLVARDQLAGVNPQYWYFWIGLLLMVVVLFMPKGILGFLARLDGKARLMGRRQPIMLRTNALRKSFGALAGLARRFARAAARLPLRADRPERRRQDDADQPDHRPAQARCGHHRACRRGHHRHARRRPRAQGPRPHLPDQHPVSRTDADRGGDAGGQRARGRRRPVLARACRHRPRRSTRPSKS